MPKAIVDFGLISACKSLISEYNSALENVSFHFEDNLGNTRTVDKNIEVTLYRILQESLNNIVKYAEANEVNVQLRDFGDVIMLTIEDNGKGFDLEEIRRSKKGFGLRSIENRIDAISGVFEIDSVPGQGTIIVVQIDKEIAK